MGICVQGGRREGLLKGLRGTSVVLAERGGVEKKRCADERKN